MSIHIVSDPSKVSDAVLMSGDPLRAKHIAHTFLTDIVQYNEIRGMYGFSGYWQGNFVSVQGSGMGMPSFSIYAHELIDVYKVKRIIRVGTCGTIHPSLRLKDILIAQAADCDGAMNTSRFGSYHFAPTASFDLLMSSYVHALNMNLGFGVGNVFTSDQFYDLKIEEKKQTAQSLGTMAVDMETCELYTLAHLKQIKALSLLTVSDSLLSNEKLSALERQTSFNSMVELALMTLFA